MKKTKVYSHALLKIHFPDGARIEAKFLPTENIATVKTIVLSTFLPEHLFQFDLFIAPPRRILADNKSLREEGLVPAAKIHVSWINGASPAPGSPPGSYLRQSLFQFYSAVSCGNAAFPASVGLTDKGKTAQEGDATKGKASREEELMQRMLGKRKGLGPGLGKKIDKGTSEGGGDKKGSAGKPKWFKG